MIKAQIIFEVTEGKTEVIATDTAGNTENTDITGTEIEKDFVTLLKKLIKHRRQQQILGAIDIDKYESFG